MKFCLLILILGTSRSVFKIVLLVEVMMIVGVWNGVAVRYVQLHDKYFFFGKPIFGEGGRRWVLTE
jgi:hypothetical protein